MQLAPTFDRKLIEKYNVSGPRYTSYPTALQFDERLGPETYKRYMRAAKRSSDPLSLYVHLPFCHSLCYYCGCTKKVTRHREHGEHYLASLFREIELQGRLIGQNREITQLHFGGGTPTFFDDQQLTSLMDKLSTNLRLAQSDEREFSIELDPRTMDDDRLATLKSLGFNRISLGIQDFNKDVQIAVNRVQGVDETASLIQTARALEFESVSVDLIYGLPLQTPWSFGETLDTVINMRPDRIAVYNYAHLPELFKSQRMINAQEIPTSSIKLALMQLSVERLCEAGYIYIGMDHFALPEDELARALGAGTLQRNFQGYSTQGGLELLGLGMSAIGKIGECYAQNLKTTPEYNSAVEAGAMPLWRGVELTQEDRLRRAVIESIMCRGEVAFSEFSRHFHVDFAHHFREELQTIRAQEKDGLLEYQDDGFKVTSAGRLLLRNIAMTFDQYLPRKENQLRFSKTI